MTADIDKPVPCSLPYRLEIEFDTFVDLMTRCTMAEIRLEGARNRLRMVGEKAEDMP
jgi:hypothetical protein